MPETRKYIMQSLVVDLWREPTDKKFSPAITSSHTEFENDDVTDQPVVSSKMSSFFTKRRQSSMCGKKLSDWSIQSRQTGSGILTLSRDAIRNSKNMSKSTGRLSKSPSLDLSRLRCSRSAASRPNKARSARQEVDL